MRLVARQRPVEERERPVVGVAVEREQRGKGEAGAPRERVEHAQSPIDVRKRTGFGDGVGQEIGLALERGSLGGGVLGKIASVKRFATLLVPAVALLAIHGDLNTCGSPPVACPLRDGSTMTLGYTDCIHEPMRLAIEAQGPSSRSKNLGLCVTPEGQPECSAHVVANRTLTNTDPSAPADYHTAMMDWILARLTDT
ncbi:MAG: hypothetical protein ACXW2C_00050 [Acidimicrobiia bacterium]